LKRCYQGDKIVAIKVYKSLTPEEKLKLASCQSILGELISGESAAAPEEAAPPPVEEAVRKDEDGAPPPAEPEKKEEEVAKSEEARDGAESRMDELPKDDESALSVLKSLLASVNKTAVVTKSAPRAVSIGENEFRDMLAVMKSMQARISRQDEALSGILEGMGVTSDALKVEKAAPRQAIQPSANDILAALASAVQVHKSAPETATAPGTMADALRVLWANQ
jgi:hypothetical protein